MNEFDQIICDLLFPNEELQKTIVFFREPSQPIKYELGNVRYFIRYDRGIVVIINTNNHSIYCTWNESDINNISTIFLYGIKNEQIVRLMDYIKPIGFRELPNCSKISVSYFLNAVKQIM